MTKYTPNLQTPYPETLDIPDIPKNMRDIATSWENAFAGVWQTWNVSMIQGSTASGELLVVTLDPTSVARYFITGKTVYAMAHLIVATGTGLTGFLLFTLPYPMLDTDEPVGIINSKYGASVLNQSGALSPTQYASVSPQEAFIYEDIGIPQARVAGDWAGLLLRYEGA